MKFECLDSFSRRAGEFSGEAHQELPNDGRVPEVALVTDPSALWMLWIALFKGPA